MSHRKKTIIIRNFPDHYPLRKKVLANIVHLIGRTPIRFYQSLLKNENYNSFRHHLQKGDIVLVGQFRRVSSLFVQGPINHALLYIGKNKLIHSLNNGVQTTSFDHIFNSYDTMMILRSRNATPSQLKTAIEYAHSRLGKPFNFEFKEDKYEKYYCSELIYQCFKQANISFRITPPSHHIGRYNLIYKSILHRNKTIHPMCYINPDFKIIHASSNLSKLLFCEAEPNCFTKHN